MAKKINFYWYDMETNTLLLDTRKNLGLYCMNICKAKCCRQGKLIISSEREINAICNKKPIELTKHPNYYLLDFNKKQCMSLSPHFLCEIYLNPDRPLLCAEFPLFVREKSLFISSFCPASAILKKTEKKFIQAGYRVEWQ